MLDDVEDIPLQEIDEMDCLKNASVKILLSFVEFLEEGESVVFGLDGYCCGCGDRCGSAVFCTVCWVVRW